MPRGGKILDLTGQKYNRLTAIKMVERNSSNKVQWLCKCDCGNLVKVTTCHLRSGHTKSCGCYNLESSITANITHGGTGTRLYNIWCDIKKRCLNEKYWCYNRYGGRGIKMCKDWKNDFTSFRDWSITHGYADDLTIDRINNDGNYEPDNCRWVTRAIQNNNTSKNHIITVNGVSKNIAQWSKYMGITRYRIDSAYKRGENLEEYVRGLLKKYNKEP